MIKDIICIIIIIAILILLFKNMSLFPNPFRLVLLIFTIVLFIYLPFFALRLYREITGQDILFNWFSNIYESIKEWFFEIFGGSIGSIFK